jgi:hypothetical protein
LIVVKQSGVCDARTQLEAGAYAAWLGGALQVELQQWRRAAESLQRAQLVLDNLCAALPEDERLVYTQKVCRPLHCLILLRDPILYPGLRTLVIYFTPCYLYNVFGTYPIKPKPTHVKRFI